MRNFLFGLLMMICASAPAMADEADIQAVISGQIEAFRADDFETAFTYASPTIKRLFGSPQVFGRMVRGGYPMVWRPARVDYLTLEARGGRLVQLVQITDQSGALHTLAYEMIETDQGWQIDGVRFVETPQIGV